VCKGGQQVHGDGNFATDFSGGDLSGPPHNAGLSHPAFEGCSFVSSERCVRAAVPVTCAVVGGEDDEGFLVEVEVFEGI